MAAVKDGGERAILYSVKWRSRRKGDILGAVVVIVVWVNWLPAPLPQNAGAAAALGCGGGPGLAKWTSFSFFAMPPNR